MRRPISLSDEVYNTFSRPSGYTGAPCLLQGILRVLLHVQGYLVPLLRKISCTCGQTQQAGIEYVDLPGGALLVRVEEIGAAHVEVWPQGLERLEAQKRQALGVQRFQARLSGR